MDFFLSVITEHIRYMLSNAAAAGDVMMMYFQLMTVSMELSVQSCQQR